MFLSSITEDELYSNFELIGLTEEINSKKEALIKINSARVYQKNHPWPKLHQNLNLSISNLFCAIMEYSPFQFFVNGGVSFNENIGEFNIVETYVSKIQISTIIIKSEKIKRIIVKTQFTKYHHKTKPSPNLHELARVFLLCSP